MTKVRFASATVALCYDAKHDRVVGIDMFVDTEGRIWEAYDGGEPTVLDSPDEPSASGKD